MSQPKIRNRIVLAGAAAASIWLGNLVAQQSFGLPMLVAGLLALAILAKTQPLRVPTLLLGVAMVGYSAGNRGFAQISLSELFPLLPAEAILAASAAFIAIRAAVEGRLPFRRDALNVAVLVWMVLSSLRIAIDVRSFGAMALRDYATVYYAAFFFIAQEVAGEARERRFIELSLLTGCATLVVLYPLFVGFQGFFESTLVFRGNPLIYYKADLAGAFMAVGSVLAFLRFERSGSKVLLVLSLCLATGTMMTNNRASMLSLFAIAALLAIGGRRRYLKALAISAGFAVVAILGVAFVRDIPLERTPLYGAYERLVSMVDPTGSHAYSGDETSYKGDNNVFRATWWRIVFDDTVRTNPWTGLGWGYDLAEPFTKVYYPEGGEDFSARSPHDIFMTVFARTGLVGFIPFVAIVLGILVLAHRAVRARSEATPLWCAACGILVSAAFGVVLEGPMGAVVFWTVLGAAHACRTEAASASARPDAESQVALANAGATDSRLT